MPAVVPIGHGYVIGLWSDRTPRVFALPTAPPEGRQRGPGRAHPIEIRLRRDQRYRWQACITLRLSIDGRQVSRTLLRVLAAFIMRPSKLPDGWVLYTSDGTCSVGSLRWVSPGDAQRLRRKTVQLEDVRALRVALRGAARDCCRVNDAAADLLTLSDT